MGLFKLVFSLKRYFVKDLILRYADAEVYSFARQDTYYWSFFEARDLITMIDSAFSMDEVKMWWNHEEGSLETNLK